MTKPFSSKFFDMVHGNLISRGFGFVREMVIASYFGASRSTDIFAIAFTIPTLFRRILGEDMVEKAFLPSFRQLIASGEYRRAWILASRIFNLMLLLLLLIMGLFYLLTPKLVRIIGAGLASSELYQAEVMTYIILPFMIAIGMASFVGGLLLFLDATRTYALAPVMLSVGVILGIILLQPYIGMYSMAVGFILGGLLQFVCQIPALIRASRRSDLDICYTTAAGEPMPEFKEVGRQSGWIFSQSLASKTEEVVARLLASFLMPGSIAALYFAQRLVQLPNAIFGLAVGRAGVTDLNDQAQRQEWTLFRETVITGLRYNVTCMLPLTAFVMALAVPITSVVFQRGAFDRTSVNLTALAVSFYALGLLGMGLWNLYSRVYPALAKNQIPLYSSLGSAAVNVGLSLLLVRTSLKHGGLALASSIAFTLNGLLLFAAFNAELQRKGQKSIGWQDVGNTFLHTATASCAGGLTAWLVYPYFRGSTLFAVLPDLSVQWGELFALGTAAAVGTLVFFLTLGYWGRLLGFGTDQTERVILTGGGTGGHVNPALAIAEVIRQRNPDARFQYVGVRGKAESVIVTRAGYPIHYVWASSFPGFRPNLDLARFAFTLLAGVLQSFYLIATYRPGTIVGTGGYVSAPIIVANGLMRALGMSRARVFIHEQNSVPGKLNRFMGRRADKVLLTFPETKGFFPENGVIVGYPVRRSLTRKHDAGPGISLPVAIPDGRRVVFAFGGSQGARTINRAVVDALGHLKSRREDIFVIHGVGLMKVADYNAWEDTDQRLSLNYSNREREEISSFYYAQDYFHNIGDIYAVSDLVVCRGGAGSLNEISATSKPALIIPKADLPGDHQVMNARAMKRAGAAEVIYEDTVMEEERLIEEVGGRELAEKILALLDAPRRLEEMCRHSRAFMQRDALERIAAEIYGNPLEESLQDDIPSAALEPLLGNTELLEILEKAWERDQGQYETHHIIADPDDLDYYRHRAASLLTSPSWPKRNLGVKLVGLLKHGEKLSSLLHLLADRTPASKVQRWFGGDYRQVGFIRRNVLIALRILDKWGPEVEARVLQTLEDGYYEVRAQAARTTAHFADRLIQKQALNERLLVLLQDKSFEVAKEAALALGSVGSDRRVAEALLNLKEHHYWQVREAALESVCMLVRRGIVNDLHWLLEEISRFILTTTDFRPHFAIKETYRELFGLCQEDKDKDNNTDT
ncbi:MAG: murein biosynthesis integral membrane protein MurJ [Deltaproteobacteria bacterium]|nr:MAG: murein biosynthesis integral membrane protein MurJ [Deltaproteobacteria bacterium]